MKVDGRTFDTLALADVRAALREPHAYPDSWLADRLAPTGYDIVTVPLRRCWRNTSTYGGRCLAQVDRDGIGLCADHVEEMRSW